MNLTAAQMAELTAPLHSKSAKIRALAEQGVERAEIARFLNLRYQHVRNVLEADKQKARQRRDDAAEDKTFDWPLTSKLDSAGRIVLPAPLRSVLGLSEGDEVVLHLDEKNGEVRLVTRAAALKRARELYRRLVPAGESLADELIADRRREGEDDSHGG